MDGKVLELESERLERKGEIKGEERLGILIKRLKQDGRNTEIQSVATDKEIRQRLYKEYGI